MLHNYINHWCQLPITVVFLALSFLLCLFRMMRAPSLIFIFHLHNKYLITSMTTKLIVILIGIFKNLVLNVSSPSVNCRHFQLLEFRLRITGVTLSCEKKQFETSNHSLFSCLTNCISYHNNCIST